MNQAQRLAHFFKLQKGDWLLHNHKKMLVTDRLSPSTRTHVHIGMKMTI